MTARGSAVPTEQLAARLASEGLDAHAWDNAPGDRYPVHDHGYDKVLVAAKGSITFELPGMGTTIGLRAGDRLDLPARTLHGAHVGPTGVTCLEAHLPTGTLPPALRHRPAWAETADERLA